MDRYMVKPKAKDWTDKGPDLLRTQANAVGQIKTMLGSGTWYWRKQSTAGSWYGWRKVGPAADMVRWCADALPTLGDGQLAQIGRGSKTTDPADAKIVVRGCGVAVPDLYNATGGAEVAHGLVRYRFPNVLFGGCFVCKRISGSSSWSDHAWGDAVDWTENPHAGLMAEEIFDWLLRMAREDLVVMAQLIGPIRGVVYTAEGPQWGPVRGGDSSHTWHVHGSIRQHSGFPPCA